MASTKRRYSKEEFARRGDEMYEKQVRPHLKAGDRLRSRLPEAQIWMVRVGSRCVHRFVGRDRRGTP
jgi:hypothetical protein